MCEEQGVARLQVRLDALCVDLSLDLVRGQDHNNVSLGCCLSDGGNAQALSLSLGAGLGTLGQANDNLHAGVTQVQCVSVTLGTVANNCYGAALDQREVCIVVVENGCCHYLLLSTFDMRPRLGSTFTILLERYSDSGSSKRFSPSEAPSPTLRKRVPHPTPTRRRVRYPGAPPAVTSIRSRIRRGISACTAS